MTEDLLPEWKGASAKYKKADVSVRAIGKTDKDGNVTIDKVLSYDLIKKPSRWARFKAFLKRHFMPYS